ncbi:nuclear receptor coactivator 2-like isoform X3 [Periplaneta americana]|uniref:nuclear receptor coactivator 2-like isoform X3 n=1 Tax=Periplaneta americana TaxID=6978 RepID=UPI0037E9C4B7
MVIRRLRFFNIAMPERSFLRYKAMLRDNRRRMTTENIRHCLVVNGNSINGAFSNEARTSKSIDQTLGPCDLQDPLWVKMSAAVSGGVNKKRKKTDTKPHAQAQINKCRNEKRRREQENIYIEELAELISASFADMSSLSVKPDKCAILKETVHQIQHIKQQEGTSSDAVQQGEVSSSKPTILSNEVFGPLLLEALEGFLFVVNTEGKVEYVTDNVCQFIKYTKEDVLGHSIYNIIHHGDHARFSASLLPMSVGWTREPSPNRNRSINCRFLIKPPDNQDETMEEKQQRVSTYEIMQISSTLLPYPSEKSEGGDVTSESTEVGPCLMCVARRIPQNEKPSGAPFEQFTTKLDVSGKIIGVDTSGVSSTYSQYLNKDLMGCIIQELCHQHDLQKLASHLKEALHTGHSTSVPYRLRVTTPDKYVHVQTKSKLFKSNGTLAQEPDFIMATHSIIGDNEIAPADCGHLSNSQTNSPRGGSMLSVGSGPSSNGNSNSMGGPLMGGPVNGQTSGSITSSTGSRVSSSGFGQLGSTSTSDTGNTSTPYTTYTLPSSELNLNDFDFFPTSTWGDLGTSENSLDRTGAPQTPSGWGERPDSRQSVTPVPTPRPPSVPSYSPVGAMCSSPLNPYSAATQPSPAGTNRATTPANPFGNSFPFSPLQEQGPSSGFSLEDNNKDSKEGIVDVGNGASVGEGTSSTPGELGRLRNLLTNKRPSTGGEEGSESMDHTGLGDGSDTRNENRILKGLLNQDDKDEARGEDSTATMRSSPGSRHVGTRLNPGSASSSDPPKASTNNNNMLLKLLNEKTDDDDLEQQKQNELLQQLLLKKQDEERKPPPMSMDTGQQQQQQEDPLLKSLGFSNPTPSPPSNTDPISGLNVSSIIGTRKRPSDEGDDGGGGPTTKRAMDGMMHPSGPQVSSSGPSTTSAGKSKLWEKNQMLASLLAKQPPKPTTIPPLPASIISAMPQEKLPRVVDPAKPRPGGGGLQPPSTTQSPTRPNVQQQTQGRRQPGPNFSMNHPEQQQQQQQQQQLQQQVLLQQKQQQLQQQQQQQHGHTHQQETLYVTSVTSCTSGDFRTSGPVGAADSPSMWDGQSSDPVLSEILDQVIDIVPESIITDNATILNILDAIDTSPSSASGFHDLNAKKAISEIQKSLMQCEQTVVKGLSSPTISLPGTPPAYTSTTMPQSGGFPPPPLYQQRPRLNIQTPGQLGVRPAGNMQYTNSQQSLIFKQRQLLQQQHKQRLLQQQQQQQLLIPSNAAAAEQLSSSGLQNIDSLLNNSVAPNVSLQRSSSVPDSQLSPNYGSQMINSGGAQISPGQRQPYSPHSQLTSPLGQPQPQTQQQVAQQPQQGFSPVGSGLNNFSNNQQGAQARLSPHPPGGLPPFQQSQLSPRISQGQQGYPALSNSLTQSSQAANNWSTQSRLSLQQQQNPMLNAQLTGSYGGGSGRQFTTQRGQQAPQQQLPPVRSLPSPGTPGGPRQSPYPPESFPPPASPTAGNYQAAGQFPQQLRLQRTISAPSATTQLPGGVNSPRPYGLKQDPHSHPQHLLSPGHPFHPPEPHPLQSHHHSQHHPMLYQPPPPQPPPDSQFCFNQADIHIYGANDRGRPQAHTPTNHQPGGGNNGISSEYVRQELRAVVGARTQQQSGGGGGGGGGGQSQGARQQQQQLQLGQQVSPTDLDSLGSLAFDIPTSGASDSKQLWGNIGSGSPQPGLSSSRNTMEESPRPGDQKSSLLQKLLSE